MIWDATNKIIAVIQEMTNEDGSQSYQRTVQDFAAVGFLCTIYNVAYL